MRRMASAAWMWTGSASPRRGHEGQHHHVGVAIEEDVLDETSGPSDLRRIHEMALHVEDELVFAGPTCARASCWSSAASRGISKKPPLRRRRRSRMKASRVLAAPHARQKISS